MVRLGNRPIGVNLRKRLNHYDPFSIPTVIGIVHSSVPTGLKRRKMDLISLTLHLWVFAMIPRLASSRVRVFCADRKLPN